ncbi:hypothetical protein HDU96_005940, partial [Phlyctochytrium bullatum]
GVMNAVHNGLGFGVGAVVAGYAYASVGPVAMFLGTAGILGVSGVMVWVFVEDL